MIGLISAWVGVFLASGRRRFLAYYQGGLWSIGIGVAIEYVIRRNLGWWNLEHSLSSLLGVGIATFLGPRFVEGLLFYQQMPKQTSLQLPAAFGWAALALVTDVITALSGFAHLSLKAASVSMLAHSLRFLALLAIFYNMSYERRAERLGLIRRQELRQRIGKALWKVSWIPLYFGVRAVVGAMDKRQR